jgi:hypothetical protein
VEQRSHAIARYLPPEVEQVLARRKVPGSALSVFVRAVDREEPLLSYNSRCRVTLRRR